MPDRLIVSRCAHTIELMERHVISAKLPDNADDWYKATVWSETMREAHDWCEREGVTATVTPFERKNPHVVGTRWDVVVVTAVSAPLGQPMRFRWGARWRNWLDRFAAMRRAQQFAPAHPIMTACEEA